MKVSFDYDETLTQSEVQDFARECMEMGYEVWIVTSRKPDRKEGNDDLYALADDLDIPNEQIVFTARSPKRDYLRGTEDFLWHLDNDYLEIIRINQLDNVQGIWYDDSEDWKAACLEAMD